MKRILFLCTAITVLANCFGAKGDESLDPAALAALGATTPHVVEGTPTG